MACACAGGLMDASTTAAMPAEARSTFLLSSPRTRGPMPTAGPTGRRPCHIESTRSMGPRVRRDDKEVDMRDTLTVSPPQVTPAGDHDRGWYRGCRAP